MSAETSCTIVATANPALVRTLTLHETGEHDLLRARHAFADPFVDQPEADLCFLVPAMRWYARHSMKLPMFCYRG
jgi:hypothetical protein